MKGIDKGLRGTNYFVDYLCVLSIWMFFSFFFFDPNWAFFTFYLIFFLYYLILEAIFGQTLGKLITKTKVIHKKGGDATLFNIIIRSFLRIVPFDLFSYLFGMEIGLHDVLSSTQLKKLETTDMVDNI